MWRNRRHPIADTDCRALGDRWRDFHGRPVPRCQQHAARIVGHLWRDDCISLRIVSIRLQNAVRADFAKCRMC